MSNTDYQIWSFGPESRNEEDPDSVFWNVGVQAVAKRSRSNKNEIANEWLSLRLGDALNLPIPPGIPLTFQGNQYFASLNLGGETTNLPPVDFPSFVERHPSLACGITIFDSWICNEDRHDENVLLLEGPTAKEDRVGIIDHGRALLSDQGVQRVLSYQDVLPRTHLAAELTQLDDFDVWDEHIRAISSHYIRAVVREANSFYQLAEQDLQSLTNFILKRRFQLRSMFYEEQKNREPSRIFFSLDPHRLWPLTDDSEDEGDEYDIEYHI